CVDVYRDGAFATIGALEVRGLGCAGAVSTREEWRTPPSGIVSAAWTFHLDNVRTQIRQQLSSPRARQNTAKIQHPDAFQWSSHNLASLGGIKKHPGIQDALGVKLLLGRAQYATEQIGAFLVVPGPMITPEGMMMRDGAAGIHHG